MKNLTTNIKKVGIGLGLLTLLLMPLKAQKNDIKCKAGVTYSTTQMQEISKGCLGIETLLEKDLTKRFFAEGEIGFYSDGGDYSKSQINLGLKYKLITKNDWTMGIKTAVGVSNENHTETIPHEITEFSKINSVNTIIALDAEYTFKNKSGINFGISKDINNDTWSLGIKRVFKPYNSRPHEGFWR